MMNILRLGMDCQDPCRTESQQHRIDFAWAHHAFDRMLLQQHLESLFYQTGKVAFHQILGHVYQMRGLFRI